MCGTAPLTGFSDTIVDSKEPAPPKTLKLIVLKAVRPPLYVFWLRKSSTANTTGRHIPGTPDFVIYLCPARWNEIKTCDIGDEVEIAWDSASAVTHVEFD